MIWDRKSKVSHDVSFYIIKIIEVSKKLKLRLRKHQRSSEKRKEKLQSWMNHKPTHGLVKKKSHNRTSISVTIVTRNFPEKKVYKNSFSFSTFLSGCIFLKQPSVENPTWGYAFTKKLDCKAWALAGRRGGEDGEIIASKKRTTQTSGCCGI